MGLYGNYTLNLYCDSPEHVDYKICQDMGEFTGRTHAECLRRARRAGWRINERAVKLGLNGSGFTICPEHAKAGR